MAVLWVLNNTCMVGIHVLVLVPNMAVIILGCSWQDHGGLAKVFCLLLAHIPWNR